MGFAPLQLPDLLFTVSSMLPCNLRSTFSSARRLLGPERVMDGGRGTHNGGLVWTPHLRSSSLLPRNVISRAKTKSPLINKRREEEEDGNEECGGALRRYRELHRVHLSIMTVASVDCTRIYARACTPPMKSNQCFIPFEAGGAYRSATPLPFSAAVNKSSCALSSQRRRRIALNYGPKTPPPRRDEAKLTSSANGCGRFI